VIQLSEKQRLRILDRVAWTVATKFYDPMLNGVEWEDLVASKRDGIARATSTDQFENEIAELLKGSSHQPRGILSRIVASRIGPSSARRHLL
jgi:hypothetical protein